MDLSANGCGIYFWVNENVLKLMVEQLWIYQKKLNCRIKRSEFMVRTLEMVL